MSDSHNEKYPVSYPLRAYYSHHKCATAWTTAILRQVCFHTGHLFRIVHGRRDYGGRDSLRAWVNEQKVEFLAYTNAEYEQVAQLPRHKGFHVIRDPRDVLVSAYFSHKNSHPTEWWPELEEHRSELSRLSKEAGLIREIEFSRPYFEAMRDWNYTCDDIVELKMEDLTAEPVYQLRRVLDHLDMLDLNDDLGAYVCNRAAVGLNRVLNRIYFELPWRHPRTRIGCGRIAGKALRTIVKNHRFERMAGGRSKGEGDPGSHYRKGQPGDWRNHFTRRVYTEFRERHGDLAKSLGYE